jgi:multidrug efflux pump subunit AcrA (membrane-fusion protein)
MPARPSASTSGSANWSLGAGFYSPARLDDAQRARDVAASQLQAAQIQAASNRPQGSEVRVARSNVEQARAALAVAEARLAYATLRAPVAGRVPTRSVEPGDTAQPGKALLTLAPNGDTELTAQIDEKNFGLLASARTPASRPMPTRASISRPGSATSHRPSTPCAARSKSAWPWPSRRPPCATK